MKNIGILLTILGSLLIIASPMIHPTEHSLRSEVVKLEGNGHLCSGEQVMAPSGVSYILTAGHCAPLAGKEHMVIVTTEDGRHIKRRIIAEDERSDLLLLEGIPGMQGLHIAKSAKPGDHIRTFTHGGRHDTYKTEGTLMETKKVQILLDTLFSPTDKAACAAMPKNKVIEQIGFFGPISLCILEIEETMTTAMVIPGSSGGEVVNDAGQLVGVVSSGDEHFGGLVPLKDIQRFMHNY